MTQPRGSRPGQPRPAKGASAVGRNPATGRPGTAGQKRPGPGQAARPPHPKGAQDTARRGADAPGRGRVSQARTQSRPSQGRPSQSRPSQGRPASARPGPGHCQSARRPQAQVRQARDREPPTPHADDGRGGPVRLQHLRRPAAAAPGLRRLGDLCRRPQLPDGHGRDPGHAGEDPRLQRHGARLEHRAADGDGRPDRRRRVQEDRRRGVHQGGRCRRGSRPLAAARDPGRRAPADADRPGPVPHPAEEHHAAELAQDRRPWGSRASTASPHRSATTRPPPRPRRSSGSSSPTAPRVRASRS